MSLGPTPAGLSLSPWRGPLAPGASVVHPVHQHCSCGCAPSSTSAALQGVHPAAAALKNRWSSAATQQQPQQPPPQQQPHHLVPTPTAALLKRHWSETQEQPKEMFARVSWGSGGVGSTPVKARLAPQLSGMQNTQPLPPPLSTAQLGAFATAAGNPLGSYAVAVKQEPQMQASHQQPALQQPVAAMQHPSQQQGFIAQSPRRPQHSGGSSGPLAQGSPVSSGGGGRSLLQVHGGGGIVVNQSPRTPGSLQPLLPDPFADMTAAASAGLATTAAGLPAGAAQVDNAAASGRPFPAGMQAFSPQQPQQPQQQAVMQTSSQPTVMPHNPFSRAATTQQAGAASSWQEAGLHPAAGFGAGVAAGPQQQPLAMYQLGMQRQSSVPLQQSLAMQQQQQQQLMAMQQQALQQQQQQSLAQQHQQQSLAQQQQQQLQPPPFGVAVQGLQPGGLHLGADGMPMGNFPGIAAAVPGACTTSFGSMPSDGMMNPQQQLRTGSWPLVSAISPCVQSRNHNTLTYHVVAL